MPAAVLNLGVDIDVGALFGDVGIVYEDAAASHLAGLKGVGDGHLLLGDEPHVAIDAAVVGKVERHLCLAGRKGLVVAVVGLHGDDQFVAGFVAEVCETEGDGQVAALMVLHLAPVDVERLLAHDGLEVEGDVSALTLLRYAEVLAIPRYSLIVSAAAGFGRHELDGVWRADDLPRLVVEGLLFSTR